MNTRARCIAGLALVHLLCCCVSAGASIAYPLKASANGRYLVDQSNAPILLMGDSPQALMANLSTAQMSAFFADRSANGFNTMWVNLLCATYTGGRADASTYDGVLPFTANVSGTSSYDLTRTNEAYFARVDQMLNLAASNGLQVLLDPIETGSFLSVMRDNGTNRCRAYGQFLGRRYGTVPNIIWMSGNDFQTWRTPGDDAVVRAVAQGIRDYDSNHLQTAELDYVVSSSLDDTNWNSIFTLNGTYTYYPTYARLLQDFARTNFLPNFLVEANYEFESLQGPVTTAPILRKQEYWTMLSGAAGQMYGNHYTWPFSSGWENFLDTPGSTEIGYLLTFFLPRAWYGLVPDTNHTLVTSNYGTFSSTGHVADNDYLTAARVPDGSLAVAYTPIFRQFAVDMSKLAGPAVTRWYDPSLGTFVPIAGSPFTNAGMRTFIPPSNNGAGDGGWLLVLETNPPPDPIQPPPAAPHPRFVQQNYAVPQSPQSQVSATFPSPQSARRANLIAVGWNDTAASVTGLSDSAGNTYFVALPTVRSNGLSQAIYYSTNIFGGTNTVTVTFDQPAAYVDLRIAEYSGLSPTNIFVAGSSASGNSSSADSGPASADATNELLFAAGMTATTFTAPGAGFTQRVITSPDADIIEDAVSASVGAQHASASLSSGAWLMQLAVFRAAPATADLLLRAFLTGTNTVVIAWPSTNAYVLRESSNLAGTNWSVVTNSVFFANGESQVIVMPQPGGHYYRLQ